MGGCYFEIVRDFGERIVGQRIFGLNRIPLLRAQLDGFARNLAANARTERMQTTEYPTCCVCAPVLGRDVLGAWAQRIVAAVKGSSYEESV